MGTTKTYRFRTYGITADPMGEVTYAAECVSGEEANCETSGEQATREEVDRWIAEHVRDTDHRRFKRTASDYAIAEPGDWK